MVLWDRDVGGLEVPVHALKAGARAGPDVEAAFPQDLEHLVQALAGLERHVLLVDVVDLVLGDEVRVLEHLGRHAELVQRPPEDAEEDDVEGLVLVDLGEVRVVSLGRGDERVKDDFRGQAVLGEFGTDGLLDSLGSVVVREARADDVDCGLVEVMR